MLNRALLSAALFAVLATPGAVRAQLPIPSFSLVGGVSHYDFKDSASSGTSGIGALRIDIPIATIVAEGSLALFRAQQFGVSRTYVVPEVQLQYQLFPLIVRPYIGVGAGWFNSIDGSGVSDPTYTASVGLRVGVPTMPIGFVAEARYRGIGGLDRHAVEYTVGIRR